MEAHLWLIHTGWTAWMRKNTSVIGSFRDFKVNLLPQHNIAYPDQHTALFPAFTECGAHRKCSINKYLLKWRKRWSSDKNVNGRLWKIGGSHQLLKLSKGPQQVCSTYFHLSCKIRWLHERQKNRQQLESQCDWQQFKIKERITTLSHWWARISWQGPQQKTRGTRHPYG